MKQYLVLNIMAEDEPNVLLDITRLIHNHYCSIETSRMINLASKFTMSLLVAGTWDTIAKLENSISTACQQMPYIIHAERTHKPAPHPEKLIRYSLEMVTSEKPGVLVEICNFLIKENIHITETYSNTYTNRLGTLISSLVMQLHIHAHVPLVELRERFLTLCESLNIDAVLEPERH